MGHITKWIQDARAGAKNKTELVIVVTHPFSDDSDERFLPLRDTVAALHDRIDKLSTQHTNFTRIRPVKIDLRPVHALETGRKGLLTQVDKLQLQLDGKPKKSKSTEYLFIAFELTGWIVKDFLGRACNEGYSERTHYVLFLGDWSKMPATTPTRIATFLNFSKYLEEYLDERKQSFPLWSPNSSSSSGSMESNGAESEIIATIDRCFALRSGEMPKKAWRIMVSYFQPEDSPVFRFQGDDTLVTELLGWIKQFSLRHSSDPGDWFKNKAKRYNETVEFTFFNASNRSSPDEPMTTPDPSQPTTTMQHTTRPKVAATQAPPKSRASLEPTRALVPVAKSKAPVAPMAPHSTSKVEPITTPKPVARSEPATASTLPQPMTVPESARNAVLPKQAQPTRPHDPPEDLLSTQIGALMEKKRLADDYLVEGDLWNARSLYEQCQHFMRHIQKPSDALSLQIITGHSAVLLEFGFPETAMAKVLRTWRRVKSTQHNILKPENQLVLIEAAYLYAKGLFRFGLYSKALESIQDAMDDIGELRRNPSPEFRIRHLHLSISFYQLRVHSLGESDSSRQFKRASEDIRESEDLLEELRETKSNTENLVEPRRLAITKLSVALSKAYIWRQQGRYETALEEAEKVLAKLEEKIGFYRPLTLQAAILCSDCLVSTSNVDEGEKLSLQIKDITLKLFGKSHPLTMEATHVLISALKIQGRQTEALRTSRYLCDTAKSSESLGRTESARLQHPTFLRYRAQLGSLLLHVGNYVEAEETLRNTCQRSTPDNPDTWRYWSELAWAKLHLQQLESAEDTNSTSLVEQLKYFDSQVSKRTLRQTDGTVEIFMKTQRVAPLNIVFSLFVMCQIELYQPEPRFKFVCDAAEYVFQQTRKTFGERHSWTLMTKLALGEAFSAFGQSSPNTKEFYKALAEECFEWISCRAQTGTHLDSDHPLILRARTELIRTELLFSDASASQNLRGHLETLHAIHHCQRLIPGPAHPDTHETLLLLLTLQISTGDLASEETKNMLLGSLEDPTVQKQRCMESLRLQERVAEVYWGCNEVETCRHILGDLVDNIERVRKEHAEQLSEIERAEMHDAKQLDGFGRVREDHAKRLSEIEVFSKRVHESLRVTLLPPQSLTVATSLEYV